MNYKYIFLIGILILLLMADNLIAKKNRTPLKSILINISKMKVIKLDQNKDRYKKLNNELKGAGLQITPELFYVVSGFITIILIILVTILSYIYKFNLYVNYKDLEAAAKILDKPSLTNINFNFNFNIILIIVIIMFFLPRLFLRYLTKFKRLIEDKEIVMLQTYTLILISSGKPPKDILKNLKERSKMFSDILDIAIKSYDSDPKKALIAARESTRNEGFEKIILSLESCVNNDRKTSIEFLSNNRKFIRDLRSINKVKKNSIKDIAGTFLLTILPFFIFAFMLSYPIFTHALKLIMNTM